MKKIIVSLSIFMFFSWNMETSFAQTKVKNPVDEALKDSIFRKNKLRIMNYSLKEFDALFFEFFQKKANAKLLTKKEFYNYTIQIAIFSDRLKALYPEQKEMATENKKKWFAETYEDYLITKARDKK
jgi:hypothetical protein